MKRYLKCIVPVGIARATLLRSKQTGKVGRRAHLPARTHPAGFHNASQGGWSGWGGARAVGES